MAATDTLITADDFLNLADDDRPAELVRGKVVWMNVPGFRHGQICNQVAKLLNNVVRNGFGRIVINNSGVITARNPDSVRGPDVSFYSYDRLPKASVPQGYAQVAPEIVFEVLSPDDRWSQVLAKISEYLNIGVSAVYVVDPDARQVHVHREKRPAEILSPGDETTFPAPLDELTVDVKRFFD